MALMAGFTAAQAADPQEVWEQAVKAKGGRERLKNVHSLAIYLKPANVNLSGPPGTWLCVFPNRYFEYVAAGPGGTERAIVVDGDADRVAMDVTGMPRRARQVGPAERDHLTLNQIVFLLESAWLQPQLIGVKRNVLTVQAGERTFRVTLSSSSLPERIQALPNRGDKPKISYDYHLDNYGDFQGVLLPKRVGLISGLRERIWDADYEVDAKYNPKLFERMPNLADGPEPWRKR